MHIEWKRRGMIAGILAGVYLGYRYLLPVSLPFLTAWLLACWLYPASLKIEKKMKLKRTLAGAVLLSLFFGVIGFLLYQGITEILSQVKTAISNYQVVQQWCLSLLEKLCGMIEEIAGIEAAKSREYILFRLGTLQEQTLAALSPEALSKVMHGTKSFLFLLSGIVVTFISAILLIGDMENIRKKIWDYSWLVGIRRVIRRLKKTTVTYLKAQVIIIAAVSAVCAAVFWLMKSPYFLILGIALGILDAVPLIGTGTFLYPAAVIFLIRGRTGTALGCVILDIITSLLREFLEPRLLGEKLGVSPIIVVMSVYLGMILFGVWGVVLGPLSFSTVYEIGREWDVWD